VIHPEVDKEPRGARRWSTQHDHHPRRAVSREAENPHGVCTIGLSIVACRIDGDLRGGLGAA
jgi:hypothetical protein